MVGIQQGTRLGRSGPENSGQRTRDQDRPPFRALPGCEHIRREAGDLAAAPYRFAPNYLRELTPPASDEAAAELEGFKLRWPEFELELQRDQRETEERAEAARLKEEKAQKQAASEKRKLAAAAAKA